MNRSEDQSGRRIYFQRRLSTTVILTGALLILACFTGLTEGGVSLSLHQILWALLGRGTPVIRTILWQLRMPRILMAFSVGGLLALSGTLLQVLLRNPLADPYVLGVSGGAAVAALLSLLGGLPLYWVMGNAFIGSAAATLLLLVLTRLTGPITPTRLLLTGIVMASGFGAIVTLLLALSPDPTLHAMLFWLMGNLGYGPGSRLSLLALILAVLLLWPFAGQLNVLLRGVDAAQSLGVHTGRIMIGLYLAASLVTAIAVTDAGMIGFVGLIVPHMVRFAVGADHRRLLPLAALWGGSLLVLADALARSLLAPRELPVGVLTAFLGIPLFLVLLARGNRSWTR
ncbi:MAG: FecCD family ABC transporter permease [Gammaproteobacteria bacterium]